MISTLDISWAAGFLEGEGTFSCARTSPQVSCAQVQREPLERLARFFGGKIYAHKGRGVRQDYFVWILYGRRAASVMMTLAGLMSPRRLGQIATALSVWRVKRQTAAQRNAAKTHCPHGHEYTVENTYVQPNGGRRCRICARASSASSKRTQFKE